MSSINPVNNPATSLFAARAHSPNSRQVQVQTQQLEQAQDEFVKRVQVKLANAEGPNTPAYSIKSRYTQIQAKIDGLTTQQPTKQPAAAATPAPTTPVAERANISAPAAETTPLRESSERVSFTGAELSAPITTEEPLAAEDRVFNFSDLESARDLIGASTNDKNFIGDYDLDGDGEISFSDIVQMLFQYDSGEGGE